MQISNFKPISDTNLRGSVEPKDYHSFIAKLYERVQQSNNIVVRKKFELEMREIDEILLRQYI